MVFLNRDFLVLNISLVGVFSLAAILGTMLDFAALLPGLCISKFQIMALCLHRGLSQYNYLHKTLNKVKVSLLLENGKQSRPCQSKTLRLVYSVSCT